MQMAPHRWKPGPTPMLRSWYPSFAFNLLGIDGEGPLIE